MCGMHVHYHDHEHYALHLYRLLMAIIFVNQEMQLDAIITHELPFDEINEAFKLLMEGKSLRCIMHL